MSKFLHGLLHVGLVALNIGALASGVLPPPYNIIVSAIVGGVQGGIGIYNHGKGK